MSELLESVGCKVCYRQLGVSVRLEAKFLGQYLELRCPRCGRRQPIDKAFSAWLQGSKRHRDDLHQGTRLAKG